MPEFRNKAIAQGIARAIGAEVSSQRAYRFMEFCGGHTHAISRYGLEDLLPANLRMIHGPGLSGLRSARQSNRYGDPACRPTRGHSVRVRRPDARAWVSRTVPVAS